MTHATKLVRWDTPRARRPVMRRPAPRRAGVARRPVGRGSAGISREYRRKAADLTTRNHTPDKRSYQVCYSMPASRHRNSRGKPTPRAPWPSAAPRPARRAPRYLVAVRPVRYQIEWFLAFPASVSGRASAAATACCRSPLPVAVASPGRDAPVCAASLIARLTRRRQTRPREQQPPRFACGIIAGGAHWLRFVLRLAGPCFELATRSMRRLADLAVGQSASPISRTSARVTRQSGSCGLNPSLRSASSARSRGHRPHVERRTLDTHRLELAVER